MTEKEKEAEWEERIRPLILERSKEGFGPNVKTFATTEELLTELFGGEEVTYPLYQYAFNKVKLIEFKQSKTGRDLAVIEDMKGNRKEVYRTLWNKHAVLIED